MFSLDTLPGWYLRQHPAGRHAAESVTRVAGAATALLGDPVVMNDFTSAQDCTGLIKSLDPLRAAVAGTKVSDRDRALSALDRVRALCK